MTEDSSRRSADPDATAILHSLFSRARVKDEFEYVCALLRTRGLEDAGWDPLEETQNLYRDLVGLMDGPLRDDTRLRLGLLLYCHLIEVDAVYGILENMLLVLEGQRCRISPFSSLYGRKRSDLLYRRPPSAQRVVAYTCDHAERLDEGDLVTLLRWMFHDQIRNAFFHSDYILYKGEFRSKESFFEEDGVRRQSLSVPRLVEILNRGLAFFHGFVDTYWQHRRGYQEPKTICGRLGPGDSWIPIQLLVDPRDGVSGFRSPPTSPDTHEG